MTKTTRKTFCVIVVLCFIIAAFVTIAWGSNGFTNWKVSTWFQNQEAAEPETPEEADKLNINGLITEVHNSDEISLRMVSYASENAIADGVADGVRITATVLPEDASDKSVNYSIAWKNPASAWADGKVVGDYVNMTVTGASATIVGKQPFGEQIIVTCTSAFDEHIAATCTVDYAKRLSSLRFHIMRGAVDIKQDGAVITDTTTGKADTELLFGTSTTYKVAVSPYFGVGTVSDDLTYTVTFTASDIYSIQYCDGKVPGSYTVNGSTTTNMSFDEIFLQAVYGTSYTNKSTFYSRCRYSQIEANGVLKATFTASGNYSSLSGSINLNFDLSTLGTAVSGVELDPGNIVL